MCFSEQVVLAGDICVSLATMSLTTTSPEYLLGGGSVVLAQLKPGLILPLCPLSASLSSRSLDRSIPMRGGGGSSARCPLPAWHHKERGWMALLEVGSRSTPRTEAAVPDGAIPEAGGVGAVGTPLGFGASSS